MKISDEAVEAACRAQYDRERGRDTWVAYEEMPQDFIDRYRTQALLILEAAAPFIAAEAWEEGYMAEGSARTDNPYRSQA